MRNRHLVLCVLPLLLGPALAGCKKKPKGEDQKAAETSMSGMDPAIDGAKDLSRAAAMEPAAAAAMDPARAASMEPAEAAAKGPAAAAAVDPTEAAAKDLARAGARDVPGDPAGGETAPPKETPRAVDEVAASGAGGLSIGGSVRFTKVLPKMGLTRSTTENTSMTFTITMGGKTLDVSNTGAKHKTEKLLAARGSTPTKLEVTYHKVTKEEVHNGTSRSVLSPIEGKTYVVEAKGGQVVVTTKDGVPVPTAESALVVADHKSLGRPNFMLDALPTTPLRIGARVPAMEAAMKKSFAQSLAGGPKEKWTITTPTITLSGKGQVDGADVAFLAFGMEMTMSQAGGFSMTMHIKGTVTIRTSDGWPIRITMSGPMDIMGTKNAGQMSNIQQHQYK